jgi:hypothetical protein
VRHCGPVCVISSPDASFEDRRGCTIGWPTVRVGPSLNHIEQEAGKRLGIRMAQYVIAEPKGFREDGCGPIHDTDRNAFLVGR